MYRILAAHGEPGERRDQLRHPASARPERFVNKRPEPPPLPIAVWRE